MAAASVCTKCAEAILEDDESTKCKMCLATYHLECAGVDEVSPFYGCAQCFEIPGNTPRRRIRVNPEDGIDTDRPKNHKSNDHLNTDAQNRTLKTGESLVNKSRKSAGTLSHKQDSVVSQQSKREEIMLQVLQQNAQILEQLSGERKPDKSCDSDAKGSVSTESTREQNRDRVQNWVRNQRPEARPTVALAARAPLRGARVNSPDRRTVQSWAQQEDLALKVTRCRTSEEFFECLNEAKAGIPGITNHSSYGKKPPNLPKFSGGDLEWLDFIAYFLESTQEYKVSDLKNVERLRDAVTDKPREIVEGTLIYSSSLPDALDQLRMTYGDPIRIIAALEKEVVMAEPVTIDGHNLQRLLLRTKRFVNYVDACGYEDLMTSRSLLTKLQDKLPFFMALRWADKLAAGMTTPSLGQFNKYLKEEFQKALSAGKIQVRMVTDKKAPRKVMTVQTESESVQVPVQKTAPTSAPQVPACPQCHRNHRLKDCTAFVAASDDVKFKLLDEQKLCWTCLRSHPRRQCQVRERCGVDGCQRRHHRIIHYTLAKHFDKKNQLCAATRDTGGVTYKIMPVTLSFGERTIRTFCFVDEGSSLSLIDEDLAKELGVSGPRESLTMKWLNDHRKTDPNSCVVSFEIAGDGGEKFQVNKVRTMIDLELPTQTLTKEVIDQFFAAGEGPRPYSDGTARLLLGLKHSHLTVPQKVCESTSSDLIAVKSRLGWVIYGGPDDVSSATGMNFRVCHAATDYDNDVKDMLQKFFDMESFGVRAAPHQMCEKDVRAMEILQSTTKHNGTRYEAGLLWCDDSLNLPASREMCLQRAKGLRLRMSKNPMLAEQMLKQIDEYMAKGYCRDVTQISPANPTWYLPVFPVVNANKPGKFRMVHDAAAKTTGGRSLNSFLLTGPDMLNSLPEVLMRFREKQVAVSADVCEMFHQVVIRDADRDAQRFMWWPPDKQEPMELRMEVMIFGAACSPATAQYVQRTNAMLYEKKFPEGAKEIIDSYYVDDGLSSFEDVTTARRVLGEMIEIQSHAGFILKKIQSSHKDVIQDLEHTASSAKEISSKCSSVLGMSWDSENDVLQFRVNNVLKLRDSSPLTRRKMLSGTMSLFDPLGLAAIIVVKAKILMKNCLNKEWDDPVSDELKMLWQTWCDCLHQLNDNPVPRFLGLVASGCELHVFVDASEEAFAAAAYVRGWNSNGDVVCSLVMSKTRVAPVRAITMPRMELQAAVMGARLASTICSTTRLQIDRRVFWTDSMDCMCWIKSTHRRYHSYVAARVNEILEATSEQEWKWVPTKDNVADDATRLSSPIGFGRWYNGPDFLRCCEDDWPRQPIGIGSPKEELCPVMLIGVVCLGLVPDAARFSSWRRIVNVTAYALRIMKKSRPTITEIQPSEAERASQELFRAAQLEEYADVVNQLSKNSHFTTPRSHVLHRVCPFLDDQKILRVNGRLPAALYAAEVRNPIILPKQSRITVLMVTFMHEKYLHGNHESVLNEIRRLYYIVGLRRLLRKIVHDCLHCQLRRPRVTPPQEGPLPEARAAIGWKVFTFCGLDYFGPFEVVVGRRREKRWVALFTCMTTRAVHLEIAHSLDMESCIMCFRMMCARRDVVPVEVRSDCGTNFVATNKELKKFSDQFPTTKWVFNPPGAPHMGGAWERMVQCSKRCFKEVVGNRPLTDEILRCALIEAEWVINSHPLTHVTLDSEDCPSLTPHDFLHGAYQRRPCTEVVMKMDDTKYLRRSWRQAQQIADHFCQRFQREVIPTLNLPTKWYKRAEPLTVGDVVMVADDTRRGVWRKGRVVKTITGRGDQVRQVCIQTIDGEITRPTVKVAKVDVKG